MKTKMRTNGDKTIAHANIKAKLGLTDKHNHNFLFRGTFIDQIMNLKISITQ